LKLPAPESIGSDVVCTRQKGDGGRGARFARKHFLVTRNFARQRNKKVDPLEAIEFKKELGATYPNLSPVTAHRERWGGHK